MSYASSINKSLIYIESELGSNVFIWNGDEYACAPSGYGKAASLEEGGMGLESDLIVNVRTELFTNNIYPLANDIINYKDKEYRIINVRMNVTQTFLRLNCADVNKDL
jgi:hypothetical protein